MNSRILPFLPLQKTSGNVLSRFLSEKKNFFSWAGFFLVFVCLIFWGVQHFEHQNKIFDEKLHQTLSSVGYSEDRVFNNAEVYGMIESLAKKFVEIHHDYLKTIDSYVRDDLKLQFEVIVSARNEIMANHPSFFHTKSKINTHWMWYEKGGVGISGPFDSKGYDLCRKIDS